MNRDVRKGKNKSERGTGGEFNRVMWSEMLKVKVVSERDEWTRQTIDEGNQRKGEKNSGRKITTRKGRDGWRGPWKIKTKVGKEMKRLD